MLSPADEKGRDDMRLPRSASDTSASLDRHQSIRLYFSLPWTFVFRFFLRVSIFSEDPPITRLQLSDRNKEYSMRFLLHH